MSSDLIRSVYAIARGARVLESELSEMTLPQLRVMRLVAQVPERASRLAERAAVSRPSLTGLLDGLEARGWVRRTEVTGDRRGVALAATEAGCAALAAEEQALSGHLADLLGTLDRRERDRAVAGLEALATALERWQAGKARSEPSAS